MKQITLFIGTILLAFSAQAQSTLFEQTVATGAQGFPSGYSNPSSLGIFSADDFSLTAQTDINSITVYGFQGDNNLENLITGFSLYIYTDAGGSPSSDPSVPGSGVLEIVNLSLSDPALTMAHPENRVYNFTVDIALVQGAPLNLPAGTYWIVPVAHFDIDAATLDPTGDSRLWYWFMSDQPNLSDCQFVAPSNLLTVGWTSWTPVSDYPQYSPVDNAFAFTVEANGFSIEQPISDNLVGSANSYYLNPVQLGVYSADDFELTAQSEISSVTVYGVQPDNDLNNYLTDFSLYIYTDAGGVPSGNPSVSGSGILEIVNLSPTGPALTISNPESGVYNFTVDIAQAQGTPLILPAGTYWLVAVPHSSSISKLWWWSVSGEHNLSDAQFIDPSGYYGNWTSWTPWHSIGGFWYKDLAFTITGDNLSIEQAAPLKGISIYPNPVENELHIGMPNGTIIKSATVFDLLGKKHDVNIGGNNSIDVSQMPPGIYLLKVETLEGTLTKKFIRE